MLLRDSVVPNHAISTFCSCRMASCVAFVLSLCIRPRHVQKNVYFQRVVALFVALGVPAPGNARMRQETPESHRTSREAPGSRRRPQETPGSLKNLREAPDWPQDGPRQRQEAPSWPQDAPRCPQDGSKMPRNGPKMAPRWPQMPITRLPWRPSFFLGPAECAERLNSCFRNVC